MYAFSSPCHILNIFHIKLTIYSPRFKDSLETRSPYVNQLINLDLSSMTNKIMTKLCPDSLQNIFFERSYICKYNTRNKRDLHFPKLRLVAQTYDGASNMNGFYNGLQAIIKEKIWSHLVYVHCYAHTLNLVLVDSASVALNVISLLSNLEKLYVLLSNYQMLH